MIVANLSTEINEEMSILDLNLTTSTEDGVVGSIYIHSRHCNDLTTPLAISFTLIGVFVSILLIVTRRNSIKRFLRRIRRDFSGEGQDNLPGVDNGNDIELVTIRRTTSCYGNELLLVQQEQDDDDGETPSTSAAAAIANATATVVEVAMETNEGVEEDAASVGDSELKHLIASFNETL